MRLAISIGALLSLSALGIVTAPVTRAQEVTLVAPGGIRCAIDRLTPMFHDKTGYTLKATIGSGGATHQQVVHGEPFDVPIVQPPYQDVIASGNVVPSTETPLATVPIVALVRKGDAKPDVSTPEALKRALLAAKSLSYPDGAGGRGGAAGVSIDATLNQLGIYDQIQPKVKRTAGLTPARLLGKGDVDFALTFPSEVDDPGVEVVGILPASVSTPTALVGFVSSHAKNPDAAKALLNYLASADASAAYKSCSMQPSH
jgi:molybdate transport system substrate-binding protein